MALKNMRHEERNPTFVLASEADSTRLEPYIVFREAIHELAGMQQQHIQWGGSLSSVLAHLSAEFLTTKQGGVESAYPEAYKIARSTFT